MASVPPSLKLEQVIDRTATIQASVRDVELTLLLAICLVVMVIFVFLAQSLGHGDPRHRRCRSRCSAPSALMYCVGYSLDNLSLMALTIAVGFVVDDAIVMLENIYRHIEDGHDAATRPPSRARARSASPSSPSASRWWRCSFRCC